MSETNNTRHCAFEVGNDPREALSVSPPHRTRVYHSDQCYIKSLPLTTRFEDSDGDSTLHYVSGKYCQLDFVETKAAGNNAYSGRDVCSLRVATTNTPTKCFADIHRFVSTTQSKSVKRVAVIVYIRCAPLSYERYGMSNG